MTWRMLILLLSSVVAIGAQATKLSNPENFRDDTATTEKISPLKAGLGSRSDQYIEKTSFSNNKEALQSSWKNLVVPLVSTSGNNYNKISDFRFEQINLKKQEPAGNVDVNDFKNIWMQMPSSVHQIWNDDSLVTECPNSYDKAGSLCLSAELLSDHLSWEDARTYCQIFKGGDLAVFKSTYEHQDAIKYLTKIDPNYVHSYWFGAADLDTEGTWKYIDGTVVHVEAHSWGENASELEPSGKSGQIYGILLNTDHYYMRAITNFLAIKELNVLPLCQYIPKRDRYIQFQKKHNAYEIGSEGKHRERRSSFNHLSFVPGLESGLLGVVRVVNASLHNGKNGGYGSSSDLLNSIPGVKNGIQYNLDLVIKYLMEVEGLNGYRGVHPITSTDLLTNIPDLIPGVNKNIENIRKFLMETNKYGGGYGRRHGGGYGAGYGGGYMRGYGGGIRGSGSILLSSIPGFTSGIIKNINLTRRFLKEQGAREMKSK